MRRVRNLPLPVCGLLGFLIGLALTFIPLPEGGPAVTGTAFSVGAALVWGNVHAQSVRFMSLVGHKPGSIIRSYILRPVAFITPIAITLWAGGNEIAALIAAIALTGVVSLSVMRVLTYLVYPKKAADWVASLIALAIAMVALAVPFAAPIAGGFALIGLASKARDKAWMIP